MSPNEPLPLSSERVHSVSPDHCDVRSGEIASSTAPVWVIGGGKTAMDTAHTLITSQPGREVNMVAGSGTHFLRRDLLAPAGARRWHGGRLASSGFLELASRFDGTNEAEVDAWFHPTMCITQSPDARNFLFGQLSIAEQDVISRGLHEFVLDHLEDVADRNGSAELQLRSGATRAVAPGSWIVNCTGYLGPGRQPYEPYLSEHGRVVSIQGRSAIHILPAFAAYFLTHLLYLRQLEALRLYELDTDAMRTASPQAFPYVVSSHIVYNVGLILDAVPRTVFSECGLDFDRWYPKHRQLWGGIQMLRGIKRNHEHIRRSLDTVRARFDVRCGPLVRS